MTVFEQGETREEGGNRIKIFIHAPIGIKKKFGNFAELLVLSFGVI